MTRSENYTHRLTVRYYEVDSQGVVFNMWYLGYADVALSGYLAHVGLTMDRLIEIDTDIHVVNAEVTYRAPLRLDDVVDISIAEVTVGRTSMTFRLALHVDGALTTEIRVVYVTHRLSDRQKIEVPETVRSVIMPSR